MQWKVLAWNIKQETLWEAGVILLNGMVRGGLRDDAGVKRWGPGGDWGMRIQAEGAIIRSVLFMSFFFLNWRTWRVAINRCSKDQSGLVEGGQEFSFRQVTFKVLIRYWSGDTHLASGYENQLVRARLKTSVCGWIKGLSVGRKGEGKNRERSRDWALRYCHCSEVGAWMEEWGQTRQKEPQVKNKIVWESVLKTKRIKYFKKVSISLYVSYTSI